MSHRDPLFIAMPPLWRVGVRRPLQGKNERLLRMGAVPSRASERDSHSLSQLRAMQDSVLRRRSKLNEQQNSQSSNAAGAASPSGLPAPITSDDAAPRPSTDAPNKLAKACESITASRGLVESLEKTSAIDLSQNGSSRRLSPDVNIPPEGGLTEVSGLSSARMRSKGKKMEGEDSVAMRRESNKYSVPYAASDSRLQVHSKLAVEGDVVGEVSLERTHGRLPWKDKRVEDAIPAPGSLYATAILPLLSTFTGSLELRRCEWYLPRVGSSTRFEMIANGKGRSADEKNSTSADPARVLEGLNEQQREAVLSGNDRACLVLAGPGSGKTRVLTHRVAYLVSKYNVPPNRILAVTFTNKAAGELKERLAGLLQSSAVSNGEYGSEHTASRLVVGTFHSIGARFLRRYGDSIGISRDFVICDTTDSRQVVSGILKKVDGKTPDSSAVGMLRAQISKLKNEGGEELQERMPKGLFLRLNEYRKQYDHELRSMNQLDFDDLLVETLRLLRSVPSVLEELQNIYEHVLVDEWQDTNLVQFDIVSLLAGKRRNLFVVGDADQSIYKFRGADIRNLDKFSKVFTDARVIALEQNYRSTACIVAAAQAVIEGNSRRPSKSMTTLNDFGRRVLLCETHDDRGEALFVISAIKKLVAASQMGSYSDVGIMYRTNAQSRLLEEACIVNDVPYRLLSGTKFYERMEIKDLVCYLRLLSNPADNNAFRRVVNTPPRGIGKKTVDALEEYALSKDISLLQALDAVLKSFLSESDDLSELGFRKAALRKLADFHGMLSSLRRAAEPFRGTPSMSNESDGGDEESSTRLVSSLLDEVIKSTSYREYIEKRGETERGGRTETLEKAMERLSNIDELVRAASRYHTLSDYLESVSLMIQDEDGSEFGENGKKSSVSLMTLHAAKGLEFGAAFITGVEDGLIPLGRTIGEGDEAALEEERRLLYVGMTRAKQFLTMTWRAQKLMIQGAQAKRQSSAGPSRFLKDVPGKLMERKLLKGSAWPRRGRGGDSKLHSKGDARNSENKDAAKAVDAVREWKVGDCVRCSSRGRGTVTVGAKTSETGAWIEVLFMDGTREYVNTAERNMEMLFSPS